MVHIHGPLSIQICRLRVQAGLAPSHVYNATGLISLLLTGPPPLQRALAGASEGLEDPILVRPPACRLRGPMGVHARGGMNSCRAAAATASTASYGGKLEREKEKGHISSLANSFAYF